MASYYAGFYSHDFMEWPPIPEAWLRASGDPPPKPDFAQLQHNMRQLGAFAAVNGERGRAP